MPKGVYKRTQAPWNKGNRVRIFSNCLTCGKKFSHFNFTKKNNPRFCSQKCVVNSTQFKKGECENEKNSQWKGTNASYTASHHWIARKRGKPHYCEHCKRSDLPHRSYNWANIDHKYNRNIKDYIRLCVRCHKKYDATIR